MKTKRGEITLEPDARPRLHEIRTAQALAAAGYSVRFIGESKVDGIRSADVVINEVAWEMKAPNSDNARAIQRNIRKALNQSNCVIFDARRMKNIPNKAIEREVRKHAAEFKSLKKLLFVNRLGEVLEIK